MKPTITFNNIIENKLEIIDNLSIANHWLIGAILFIFICSFYYVFKKNSYFWLISSVMLGVVILSLNFLIVDPIKQYNLEKIAYLNMIKGQCSIVSVNRANRHVNLKGFPFFNNEVVSINIDCGGKKQTVEI